MLFRTLGSYTTYQTQPTITTTPPPTPHAPIQSPCNAPPSTLPPYHSSASLRPPTFSFASLLCHALTGNHFALSADHPHPLPSCLPAHPLPRLAATHFFLHFTFSSSFSSLFYVPLASIPLPYLLNPTLYLSPPLILSPCNLPPTLYSPRSPLKIPSPSV